MRKLFLAGILLACAGVAVAQIARTSRGKEFYGMVMKNSGATGPEYFRVFLSCPVATKAELSITDGSYDTTFTIVPNVVSTVNLPLTVEDISNETATYQAIHIVADTDISVYVIYHKQWSSDSYLALPVSSLGTDYIAVCYRSTAGNDRIDPFADYSSDPKASEFGIIATQDSTVVTFTPSSTTQNQHPVGVPFTVTLNKGETYLVYGDPTDPASDLTGSAVSATKPIAFLSGHDRVEIYHGEGESRNCLVEQIPSNGTLGTSFITVPYEPRPYPVPDYFRIVAPIDSTVILKDGAVVATINAGQFYEFSTLQPSQIQTNNPVVLAQYSQSETDVSGQYIGHDPSLFLQWNWDPTMLIVPPTQQFLPSYIFSNQVDQAFDSNFINVVIPDTAVASLILDGGPISTAFRQVAGSGYSYAQIYLPQGSHSISASAPFGLYMYGIGPADAYANTGGAAFKVLNGLLVTTNDINYGNVDVDSCKDSIIWFKNIGQAPITVWKLAFADSGAGDFTITSGAPPFSIAPGDSHAVHVNFCPSVTGLRGIVNVQISSNAAEHPIITLHGVGVKPGLTANVQSLDCDTARDDYAFGNLDCNRDTFFIVRNIGNLIVNINSITITGQDAGDFRLVAPLGSFSIQPGDSIKIEVRFSPTSDGLKRALLQTVSNAATEISIPLQGNAVSGHLVTRLLGWSPVATSVLDTIDFGTAKIGQKWFTRVTIINNSDVPVALQWPYTIIDSLGAAWNDFTSDQNSGNPDTNPLVILPGDSVHLIVYFKPRASGLETAELKYVVSTCDSAGATRDSKLTFLEGGGVYPDLGINPKIVDYHRVKVGRVKDSLLALQNFGVVTADVKQYAIIGTDAADFLLDTIPVPPLTLPANANAPLGVRFAPLSIGAKHAQLIVTSDDSIPQVVADLYGNATPSSYAVVTATDTIHGKIGDTILVPVHLLTALDDADIDKYHIVVNYDSTMLYPLGVSSDSTWDVMNFPPQLTYGSGYSDVAAQAPGNTTLSGAGTLFYVSMQVLLGDAMQTPLTLTAARYTDNTSDSTAVVSAVHHGLFILDDYCAGQQGLIQVSGNYSLGSVSPNPLNGSAQIPYDIAIAGHVQLGMYNMLGEQALPLVDADQQPGHYVAFVNGRSLPQGAYILVLQSGRYRETRRVMVLR